MDKYLRSALTTAQVDARTLHFVNSPDNIKYNLFLKLKKGDTFEGSVHIEAQLQKADSDLFIDYAGTIIKEVNINGTKVPTNDNYESERNLRFIPLPAEHLKEGKNDIRISFANVYTNDRVGLHSFVDTDGHQYLYSQGEAYGTNKIFPCFDQPNLKAELNVVAATPKDWIAVSNEPVSKELTDKLDVKTYLSEEDQKEYYLTAFLPTPRISTYLYAFGAGAYDTITCEDRYNNIPMACYVRKTLTSYLKKQADEIFDILKETIKFYETYFNYPYPFSKYDYLFYPECYFGGMENPGLVVIVDSLIWKEEVTLDRNTRRVTLFTHEAAHMWFGDLVTMRWWNDLWLNESFADFISHFCLDGIEKNLKFKTVDVWALFFKRKGWGYDTDQLRTTHPIAGQVLNTDQAETVFDGITYSKGAAIIKQLIHLIGRENFGKAMSSYFKKYEWSNATLNDFIGSLEEYYQPQDKGSLKSLAEWKSEFLDTAGLNELNPIFDPTQEKKDAELVIQQTAVLSYHPTLRHHKMKVGFIGENLEVVEVVDVVLNNAFETKITYDGTKKPKAVLLNYQDEAFVKVRLDQHSTAFFSDKLHLVQDELTKIMLWRILFDMVKDGKLSGARFVETAQQSILNESSDAILDFVFKYSNDIFNLSPSFLVKGKFKPTLFESTLKTLTAADKSNNNRLILLKENLISLASSSEETNVDNITRLGKWIDGQDDQLKGVELSLQNKWAIVTALHKHPKLSEEEKKGYFNKVAELDKSNTAKLQESKCEALRAGQDARKNLWKSYLDADNKLSLEVIEASMQGYNASINGKAEEHEDLFFGSLIEVFKTRGNEFAQSYYNFMFPQGENIQGYIERIEKILPESEAYDWLVLSLKTSLDNLADKKKVYACYGSDVISNRAEIRI